MVREKTNKTNYLTVQETREEFRISVRQIRIAIRDGSLPAVDGRPIIIRRSAIKAWLKRKEKDCG